MRYIRNILVLCSVMFLIVGCAVIDWARPVSINKLVEMPNVQIVSSEAVKMSLVLLDTSGKGSERKDFKLFAEYKIKISKVYKGNLLPEEEISVVVPLFTPGIKVIKWKSEYLFVVEPFSDAESQYYELVQPNQGIFELEDNKYNWEPEVKEIMQQLDERPNEEQK